MKIETVKIIDSFDFDKLVKETYGKIYCFQQQDGCKPRGLVKFSVPDESYDKEMADSVPEVINREEMGVKFQSWIDRDVNAPLNPTDDELDSNAYYWGKTDDEAKKWKADIGHIRLFWQRNFYPDFQALVNDLHEKGLIEEGDYSLNIDW